MPELTPSQQEAIYTHDRNLIVVAGAGSGKTFVLVERYLALLDSHPDWQLNQLVAITFTQKAAQEMRDRVREALRQRLYAAEDDDAIRVWSQRLAAMDSARIDTIHALCASILRANAAEAGIDPAFSVLDEVEAQLVLENAIDDTLRGLVAEGSPAVELFREYETRLVREMLAEFVSIDMHELPADLMETWTTAWFANADARLQALYEDAEFQSAVSWQPADGLPTTADKLFDIWRMCFDCIDSLRASEDLSVPLDALVRLSSEIKLTVGSAGAWGGKDVLDEAKAHLRYIREAARKTLEMIGDPPGERDRRAAELLPHWVLMVRSVQDTYRRAKLDRAALDFDDLERLTRDLLHDYSHVRERYCGNEFKHVLVDEFQDTNAVQWEIVQAVASPELPGSLFVVGDPKQSIYAFRGADVSVFERVRAQLGNGYGREIPLMRSFRTHRILVDGFNSAFARILVRDEHSPVRAYQTTLDTPMEAFRVNPPCDRPALELILLDKSSMLDEENRADKIRRWEARQIARRLCAVVEDGRPVHDKKARAERPVSYGDIAILFQSMSRVTLYEDVFKEEGLPFVTVAGRGYYDRQEVWDMLNLLRALHNPADALSLTAALRSPLFSLSDDALLALRLLASDRFSSADSLWLWEALGLNNPYMPAEEAPRVRFAAECLSDLRRIAGRVTIWELLSEALERTGYLATLTGLPDGARRRGNVEKLLEKAQSSGKITLGAFSQYLKDLSDREIHEGEAALEGEGAVKLMTVHKSKGLEFPVVVLADASWEKGGRGGALLVYDGETGLACKVYDHDKNDYVGTFAYNHAESLRKAREEAERRRLLYVAATRAQDLLIVSGQVDARSSPIKANGWLEWLVDGLELRQVEVLESQQRNCGWGMVEVTFPKPQEPETAEERERANEQAAIETDEPADVVIPPAPPLLASLTFAADAPARALTATQIADLGGAIFGDDDRTFYTERWKRKVLHDAPVRIDPIAPLDNGISPGKITEIVHKTLRQWRPSMDESDLRKRLDVYAWEEGIVNAALRSDAVDQAYRLVQGALTGEIYRWMRNANLIYSELPFVYQVGQRVIHGVIDVLLRRADGTWALLDYKPGFVASHPDHARLAAHARRYHLQVGVYAAAARELLGIDDIEVYIHYIRHELTVNIPADAWQSALNDIEVHIRSLMGVDDR